MRMTEARRTLHEVQTTVASSLLFRFAGGFTNHQLGRNCVFFTLMAVAVQHLPERLKSEHSDCVAGNVDRRKRWLRKFRERNVVESHHRKVVGNTHAMIGGAV